ncbi:MAG TPA: glycosyltransferase family 87 protein [Anaerolineales bacterium]
MQINLWLFVYYIHQCLQFFLANIAYQLSRKLASRIGFSELAGAILVSGLFVFNYPLIRTLHLNQINLYTLIAVLAALLTLQNRPFISGIAVAFGGLIKIYPLVLTAPLFLAKRWKVVLGVITGLGAVILLQTRFAQDLLIWKQFIRFYLSFPFERESSMYFRNSSPLSFIRGFQLAGLPESLNIILFIGAALGIVAWMVVRFEQRRKSFMENRNADPAHLDFGHLIDFSVLTLFIAPSAWDHHYLIAVPLALWAIALGWKEKHGWVIFGLANVFILPPFDVFPFSYVRTLGVIILLVLASPTKHPMFDSEDEKLL